jgi:hypothetical protein
MFSLEIGPEGIFGGVLWAINCCSMNTRFHNIMTCSNVTEQFVV